MPPKKTEKSVAAEIKKKNTAEATNIVETLKRASQRDKTSSSKSHKHASLMENLFDSAKKVETGKTGPVKLDVDIVKEPPRKIQKTASQSKGTDKAKDVSKGLPRNETGTDKAKDIVSKGLPRNETGTDKAKDVISKGLPRNETIMSSKSANDGPNSDLPGARSFGDPEHGDSIATSSKASSKVNSTYGKKSTIDEGKACSKTGHGTEKSKTGHGTVSSNHGRPSAKSATYHGSKNSRTGYGTGRSKTGHGTGYQFEIDCAAVSDTIDVADLQEFLEAELRVDGLKNNLGNTIKVFCKGQTAVVTSKVYLPKKALRTISKKFLKKNYKIRVVSKNVHSYEYKYIGHI